MIICRRRLHYLYKEIKSFSNPQTSINKLKRLHAFAYLGQVDQCKRVFFTCPYRKWQNLSVPHLLLCSALSSRIPCYPPVCLCLSEHRRHVLFVRPASPPPAWRRQITVSDHWSDNAPQESRQPALLERTDSQLAVWSYNGFPLVFLLVS